MESTFDKAVKAKGQKGEITYLSIEDSRKIDKIVSDAMGRTVPNRGITPYENLPKTVEVLEVKAGHNLIQYS